MADIVLNIDGMKVDFIRIMRTAKAKDLLKRLREPDRMADVDRCFEEADDPSLSHIRREWLVMTKRSTKQSSQEKAIGVMDHVAVTEYGELLGIDKDGMAFAAFIPNDEVELWDHEETKDEPGFTKEKMVAFYDRMLDKEWDEGIQIDKKALRLNIISSDAYTVRMRGILLKRSVLKDTLKYLADRISVRYDGEDMLMMESRIPTGVCYVFMRRYTF